MPPNRGFALPPIARPQTPGFLEWAFAIYGILFYEAAFFGSLRAASGDPLLPGETDPTTTIAQYILLGALLTAVWRHRYAFLRLVHDAWPLLFVVAICVLSVLWADYPAVAIRRSVNYGLCIFFGYYLFTAFGLPRTIRLVAYCTLFSALASLTAYIAWPSVGRESEEGLAGLMRGVFPQKNSCAETMVLGIVCWIYLGVIDARLRLRSILAILIQVICIILAHSASGLIIAAIVLLMGVLYWSRQRSRFRLVIIYFATAAAAAVVLSLLIDPAGVLGLIGRDPSLTGRVPLWEKCIEAIMARPWLGYGFGSFWNADSPLTQYIWFTLGWDAPTAHSGYLDILLQVGIIGSIPYIWLHGRIIQLTIRAAPRDPPPEIAWIALFMAANLLINFDEARLSTPEIFGALTPLCLFFPEQWQRRWRREHNSGGVARLALASRIPAGRSPMAPGSAYSKLEPSGR